MRPSSAPTPTVGTSRSKLPRVLIPSVMRCALLKMAWAVANNTNPASSGTATAITAATCTGAGSSGSRCKPDDALLCSDEHRRRVAQPRSRSHPRSERHDGQQPNRHHHVHPEPALKARVVATCTASPRGLARRRGEEASIMLRRVILTASVLACLTLVPKAGSSAGFGLEVTPGKFEISIPREPRTISRSR